MALEIAGIRRRRLQYWVKLGSADDHASSSACLAENMADSSASPKTIFFELLQALGLEASDVFEPDHPFYSITERTLVGSTRARSSSESSTQSSGSWVRVAPPAESSSSTSEDSGPFFQFSLCPNEDTKAFAVDKSPGAIDASSET